MHTVNRRETVIFAERRTGIRQFNLVKPELKTRPKMYLFGTPLSN